ncbi:MAG TPA: STAS domain-containing protein [Solirubrobacteraceae bacterium]|nr:STAS domain-containing protein [Solirubrobacteraceae bacterium]
MKRHLTASAVGAGDREGLVAEAFTNNLTNSITNSTRAASGVRGDVEPSANERKVALSSVSEWTHTLVLRGELTHRSAHALELEIERLCAAGVTGITLDLRELAGIDAIGVAVIAFRSGLCKRRGYEFALIAGSRQVRRAFEQAGVADLLPSPDEQASSPPEPARVRPLALAHS